MASRSVASFEGSVATGELGGLVGEATVEATDTGALASAFQVETPSVFIGGGNVGVVQRVYIEADTQGLSLTPSIVIDGTVTALASFSTASKQQVERAINLTGFVAAVRIDGAVGTITKRIEISAIELDVYIPTPEDGR